MINPNLIIKLGNDLSLIQQVHQKRSKTEKLIEIRTELVDLASALDEEIACCLSLSFYDETL